MLHFKKGEILGINWCHNINLHHFALSDKFTLDYIWDKIMLMEGTSHIVLSCIISNQISNIYLSNA